MSEPQEQMYAEHAEGLSCSCSIIVWLHNKLELLYYLGCFDMRFKLPICLHSSRLCDRAEPMPLDEGIQHGLRGHGALGEGGLPEGVLTHGLPGQAGSWVLDQKLRYQVLKVWGCICKGVHFHD